MMTTIVVFVAAASSVALLGDAFSPSFSRPHCMNLSTCRTAEVKQSALWAAEAAGGKKKRRRRKQPPGGPTNTGLSSPVETASTDDSLDDYDDDDEEEIDVSLIKDVANFKFDGEILTSGRLSYCVEKPLG